MNPMETSMKAIAALLLFWTGAALGQSFSSGSNGSDGALNAQTAQTITVRAGGVYHYTTFTVGSTITYVRGQDNSPVVILATGDVTINGLIQLVGGSGLDFTNQFNPGGVGGPGGFPGGNGGQPSGTPASAGLGPGGASGAGGSGAPGGNYRGPDGFVTLIPLFGGSGGGGGQAAGFAFGGAGGGGGGAILIASSTKITVNGQVVANGGNASGSACTSTTSGAGSGGAIRLVAPQILGTGTLSAARGNGGCSTVTQPTNGKIRLEASNLTGFTGATTPVASTSTSPGPVSTGGNPALANLPTLSIASIGGVTPPPNPAASFFAPDINLAAGTANPVPVMINATNTPVGAPTEITLRRSAQNAAAANTVIPATDHTGTFATSSATTSVTLSAGVVTVLQAFANFTLTGQMASLFPLIDGEPVARVAMAADFGAPSTLSLVTASGREVPFSALPSEQQLLVAAAWQTLQDTP